MKIAIVDGAAPRLGGVPNLLGAEVVALPLADPPPGASPLASRLPELEAALAAAAPDAILLDGADPAALAAALAAAKLGLGVVSTDAGRRARGSDPGRPPPADSLGPALVDRLADLRLCRGADQLERLDAEGLAASTVLVADPESDPRPAATAIADWIAAAQSGPGRS